MSGGGNTSTTTSGPPPQFLQAYQNVVNQAQNVAGTPYQPYPGNMVAPLSPDQNAGISATESAYGMAAPYINSAADYVNNSTAPVLTPNVSNYFNEAAGPNVTNAATAGAAGVTGAANTGASGITSAAGAFNPNSIQQFVNPYTDQVVGATERQFANQNAQQQSQLAGNAASQGAWGGDRSAVAQSLLAGQQQLSQAPAIANLESQGYQTGVQAAEQQAGLGLQGATAAGQMGLQGATAAGQMGMQGATTQAQLQQQAGASLLGANEAQGWLNSQAGYGMANLGNEALNTTLTGANSLLGVGGLEQQQAQEGLNVPYEQYIAQQAYPFQTTGWLANIAEGLGGAAGGTSSTTYPSASLGSQVAGGLTAGAGLLGTTGAFGNDGWMTGAGGLFGGSSGLPSGGALDALSASAAGNVAAGAAGIRRGGTVPHRAGGGMLPVPSGVPDLSVSVVPGAQGMGVASTGHGMSPLWQSNNSTTQSSSGGSGVLGALETAAGIGAHFLNRGGNVRFGMRPSNDNAYPEARRAAGGSAPVSVTMAPGSYAGSPGVPHLSMAPVGSFGGSTPAAGNQSVADYLSGVGATASHAAPQAYQPPQVPTQQAIEQMVAQAMAQQQAMAPAMGSPAESAARGGMIHRDAGGEMPDDAGGAPPDAPPVAPVGMQPVRHGGDPWQALMYTGLGIMGGRSPNALTNVGQGALQGLKLYDTERRNESLDDYRQQQGQSLMAYRKQEGDMRQQQMAQTSKHQQATEGMEAKRLAQAADTEAQRIKLEDARLGIEAGNSAESRRYHDAELAQGHYTWQPGTQADASGNPVEGSWRYSARGDEPPQFFPGVVQQRTTNADQRQTTQQQSLALRQKAMDMAHDDRTRALVEHASDADVNAATRMIYANPQMTFKDALGQVQENRPVPRPTMTAPGAPAPTQAPAQAPAVPSFPAPPPAAIDLMKQHPELAPQFIQKYGAGAYKGVFGGS